MEGENDDEPLDWDDNFVYVNRGDGSKNVSNDVNIPEAEELPEFDAEAHQYFTKFGLQLVKIDNKGRGLIATRDFKAGECVLKQPPLALSLSTSDGSIKTRCGYCLEIAKVPKRCSKCRVIHYCCVEHQKKDWPIHSPECSRMSRCIAANQNPTATIIMLGRIFDVMARGEKGSKIGNEIVPGTRYHDLLALDSLQKQHSPENLISFSQVCSMQAFRPLMESHLPTICRSPVPLQTTWARMMPSVWTCVRCTRRPTFSPAGCRSPTPCAAVSPIIAL